MTVDKDTAVNRLKVKLKKWAGELNSASTDTVQGSAICIISKSGKKYQFMYKSKNARDALSVLTWSICRLIDLDERGIFPFVKTAKDYLQITGTTEPPIIETEEKFYELMGLTSEASNDEVMKKYKQLARDFHPDTATDPALKLDLEKRFSEISGAYNEIKKARRF